MTRHALGLPAHYIRIRQIFKSRTTVPVDTPLNLGESDEYYTDEEIM